MTMTRHSGRSSFTFEIKRANRRTPEVITLSKASSPQSSSLADQVFGKFSGRSPAQQPDRIDVPVSDRRMPTLGTNLPDLSGATEASAERSPRRVLPDLLTVGVNRVTERVRRDAEERTARRKAARVSRARNEVVLSVAKAQDDDAAPASVTINAEVVTQPRMAEAPLPKAVVPPLGCIKTGEQTATSRKRKRNALLAAFKKAERYGQPIPRLPAGQRWKRRLPKACW
jgi:hypothetical protein